MDAECFGGPGFVPGGLGERLLHQAALQLLNIPFPAIAERNHFRPVARGLNVPRCLDMLRPGACLVTLGACGRLTRFIRYHHVNRAAFTRIRHPAHHCMRELISVETRCPTRRRRCRIRFGECCSCAERREPKQRSTRGRIAYRCGCGLRTLRLGRTAVESLFQQLNREGLWHSLRLWSSYSFSNWRAITRRWISLVPSPMVHSFTSR
jgi:hypothetical protein